MTASLAPEIIRVQEDEDDLIKEVQFSSDDLADDEEIASIDDITVYATDHRYRNAAATSDVVATDNGYSGTVAQLKFTELAEGYYLIVVSVTTTEAQQLVAKCRLRVDA